MEKEKKLKVYLAGKLNAEAVGYNNNRSKMMHCAINLHNLGYSVFVPCLVEQLALVDTKDWIYDDYFLNSQPWLEASDVIYLVPGWQGSKGTEEEIESAIKLNIPIFEDILTLNTWRKQLVKE